MGTSKCGTLLFSSILDSHLDLLNSVKKGIETKNMCNEVMPHRMMPSSLPSASNRHCNCAPAYNNTEVAHLRLHNTHFSSGKWCIAHTCICWEASLWRAYGVHDWMWLTVWCAHCIACSYVPALLWRSVCLAWPKLLWSECPSSSVSPFSL